MIEFIKKSGVPQILAVVLIALCLWARSFVVPPVMEAGANDGPVYVLLCRLIGQHGRLCAALGLLFTLVEAAYLNLLLDSNKLLPQKTLMPAMCYVILSGFGHSMQTLTDLHFVNLAVIYSARRLMTGTQATLPRTKMCNAATAIATATLFYVPSVYLLIPFLVMYATYRMYQWRDFMALILGLAAPYTLVMIVAYMADKGGGLWEATGARLTLSGWHVTGSGWLEGVCCGTTLLLCLLCFMRGAGYTSEQSGNYKRNANTTLLPIIGSVAVAVYEGLWPLYPQAGAVPLTMGCTLTLLHQRRRKWIGEAGFWLVTTMALTMAIFS
ncbi:MAG: hypothetical protein J6X62_07150 [Bacteroidales bacterium]|nr:hypothetical protein [Bacteroidales bacterium]